MWVPREFNVQDCIEFSGSYPRDGALLGRHALQMVNVDPVNTNTRLYNESFGKSHDQSAEMTHHANPLTIFQILFRSPSNTLRLMQTKQAVIKLPYNILC